MKSSTWRHCALSLLISACLAGGCSSFRQASNLDPKADWHTVNFPMYANGADHKVGTESWNAVVAQLGKMEGVAKVFNFEKYRLVEVLYDANKTDFRRLSQPVESACNVKFVNAIDVNVDTRQAQEMLGVPVTGNSTSASRKTKMLVYTPNRVNTFETTYTGTPTFTGKTSDPRLYIDQHGRRYVAIGGNSVQDEDGGIHTVVGDMILGGAPLNMNAGSMHGFGGGMHGFGSMPGMHGFNGMHGGMHGGINRRF